ncbi:DUF4238 domain-containing protein [Aliarcobacter butzleri]|uniref:DUF4238 domain-containing protein n=1 Tax=Aliarcobacter butzleri TaxID=28197 RepID=UPI001EDAF4C0|nr:DUF4238 domain-containing protein [Aliarcobacter butzleri]MCG3684357.1 DUF4238 domain-containing protein [Aliarcobacter butzleri]
MAGSRHHFIPRFLMRGFSTLKKKKQYQTWVYKQGKVLLTNTGNINIETYFYGTKNDIELDDKITQNESDYLNYFDEIKDYKKSTNLDKDFCINFIVHVIQRSKYVRTELEERTKNFYGELESQYRTEESFEENLINVIHIYPEKVKQKIINMLMKDYPSFDPFKLILFIDESFRNIIDSKIAGSLAYKKENLFTHELSTLIKNSQKDFFEEVQILKENSDDIAKNSHNNSLYKIIGIDHSKTSGNPLLKLNWLLHYNKNANYILGDVCAIKKNEYGDYSSLLNNSVNCSYIFFPITSEHLIVGYSSNDYNIPDPSEINREIAKASQECFISKLKTEINESLAQHIGTNVY